MGQNWAWAMMRPFGPRRDVEQSRASRMMTEYAERHELLSHLLGDGVESVTNNVEGCLVDSHAPSSFESSRAPVRAIE